MAYKISKERNEFRKSLGLKPITIWDVLLLRTINIKAEVSFLFYKLKKKLGFKYWKGETLKTEYYNDFAKTILNEK